MGRVTAWRRHAPVALAASILAVAVAFVAHDVQSTDHALQVQVSENKGIPSRDRQVQAAYGLQVSPDFLIEARAFVSRGQTYRLVTGPSLGDRAAPVWSALPAVVAYALEPRQASTNADWLLCYGCDFSKFAGHAEVAWQDGYLVIARLR
jgi:hypothetical protein